VTAQLSPGIIAAAMDAATIPMPDALPRDGDVVIYDLEYTAWPGSRERGWSGPDEHREVIQIGAVRLAAADLSERASFERLVRPVVNPRLSAYIVDLTDIDDAAVAARGVAYAEALAAFADFVAGCSLVGSFGDDAHVLRETGRLNGLADDALPAGLSDIRPLVERRLPAAPDTLSSSELPAQLGVANPGQPHDALADARAVALALRELRRQGRV